MQAWIYHNRRLFLTVVGLCFTVALLTRGLVFYETNSRGEPDKLAMLRSILDNLLATIAVTTAVSIAVKWLRGPIDPTAAEQLVWPFQIDDALREGALRSREWYYLGHTGRFVRSQILPTLSNESHARNESKRIMVIILNPTNPEACRFYADYRNDSRSRNMRKEIWTEDTVRAELLATILCMIELQQANAKLDINVGLIEYTLLFRTDISSSMVLVTQEDSQEPAIRYSSESHFFRCYRRHCELAWKQSTQLLIRNAKTPLVLANVATVRSCLEEVGVSLVSFSDKVITAAGTYAIKKESPYASR